MIHAHHRTLFAGAVRGYFFPLALLLSAVGVGCGGTEGPQLELGPLSGTVALDGKPADGVSITFLPKDDTAGNGGWAVTDANGKFTAKQYSGEEGLPKGTYTVQFSRLRMPDGGPIPKGKDAADVGAVESLPPRLSNPNPEFSPYVVTIPSTDAVEFELSTKR